MEEDKKKKRNKKKKNKLVNPGGGSLAVEDHSHVAEQNSHGEVSKSADVQNDAVLTADADPDRHHNNGTGGDMLQEPMKQLQSEKDLCILKEAGQEMRIAKLQDEKDLWIQKEATLEVTIKQLQNEKDMHIQKEAVLEMRITELQCEKDLWLQKEARLEEKIGQILDEHAALSLKGANMEEGINFLERQKDSWILQESRNKDTFARLNENNKGLQLQVMELEEFQNNLIRENQKLMETTSSLQSQIQNLEVTKDEELSSQIDAALALVDKLMTENAELVERVNELCRERDRRLITGEFYSSDPITGNKTSDVELFIPESRETASASGKRTESSTDFLNAVSLKDENSDSDGNMEVQHGAEVLSSLEIGEAEVTSQIPVSEEIVQIPLDENKVRDLESQADRRDEMAPLPLSDAPLIGAPFRLVSFMAKYVSGADLINRRSEKSSGNVLAGVK